MDSIPVVGAKLRIVGDNGEGHGIPMDTVVVADVKYSDNKFYVTTPDGRRPYVHIKSVELLDRKAMATFLRKKAAEYSEEIRQLNEKALTAIRNAEGLEKYSSDEEEVASLLVEVMSSDRSKVEKVTKITALLKDRIKPMAV